MHATGDNVLGTELQSARYCSNVSITLDGKLYRRDSQIRNPGRIPTMPEDDIAVQQNISSLMLLSARATNDMPQVTMILTNM